MSDSIAERLDDLERPTATAEVRNTDVPRAEGPRSGASRPELPRIEAHQPRAVGSPLPMGSAAAHAPSPQSDSKRLPSVPSPGRSLASSSEAPPSQRSTLQRTVKAIRAALPYVERFLPLLDGNFATTVSNILTPHPPTTPPAPPIDLTPVELCLSELQTKHGELCDQVAEQNSSLKRVEDQLEMVREATDRNTLEQQELLEDLKSVGNKVNFVAVIAIGLLGISILINLLLFMHIQRVLP